MVPLEETLGALNELKAQGKIRAIGVSNFSLPQLKEACGFGQVDALQSPYSLFWRYIEPELMPYCPFPTPDALKAAAARGHVLVKLTDLWAVLRTAF